MIAAQSTAMLLVTNAASPGVLAPGLEGTDFRGVGGWGRRPVPQNKRRLEDALPGKPKKIGFRRDRGSQGIAKFLLMS
jgi:hypothetical protein